MEFHFLGAKYNQIAKFGFPGVFFCFYLSPLSALPLFGKRNLCIAPVLRFETFGVWWVVFFCNVDVTLMKNYTHTHILKKPPRSLIQEGIRTFKVSSRIEPINLMGSKTLQGVGGGRRSRTHPVCTSRKFAPHARQHSRISPRNANHQNIKTAKQQQQNPKQV